MEPVLTFFAWRKWTVEHLLMPGIVEFPQVERDAMPQYGDLFANEWARENGTPLNYAQRKAISERKKGHRKGTSSLWRVPERSSAGCPGWPLACISGRRFRFLPSSSSPSWRHLLSLDTISHVGSAMATWLPTGRRKLGRRRPVCPTARYSASTTACDFAQPTGNHGGIPGYR